MATTYLTRTPGSTGSTTKMTLSAWVKKADLSTSQDIYSLYDDNNNQVRLRLRDNGAITIYVSLSNVTVTEKRSTRLLRDASAWYHIVLITDLTESAAEDKYKIYINNERITSWEVNTNTSATSGTNHIAGGGGWVMNIGCNGSQDGNFFSGAMSYVYFSDGYAYAPTVFGSTDATSGEWVINTSPSVTYGTNGFLIMKDGNTITDQGSNSNDFTLGGGTLTDLQDCPADVFATFNPLLKSDETLSNCNTTTDIPSSSKFGGCSTIGVDTNKGKFYAEFMYKSATANDGAIGIFGDVTQAAVDNQGVGKAGYSYSYQSDGQKLIENTGSSYGATYDDGDVISIALDTTNSKLYFAKDGVWQNSGDPESGATGTGAIPIVVPTDSTDACWTISACSASASAAAVWKSNWGNGYFGDSAISSEGTNASGIGKFEFDVPAGYTALSTKGLQE